MSWIKERDKVTFSARLGEQHLTQRHLFLLIRCCRGSVCLLGSAGPMERWEVLRWGEIDMERLIQSSWREEIEQTGKIRSCGIAILLLLLLLSPSSRVMWLKMPLHLPGSVRVFDSTPGSRTLGICCIFGDRKTLGLPRCHSVPFSYQQHEGWSLLRNP